MNIDLLIAKIMNNPPYQLPPVVHGNGVYQLDIEYLGVSFNKIGFSMEEVLEGYFHFATKTAYQSSSKNESIIEQPVKPGYRVKHRPRKSHHG
ncbi:hypothetical protein [Belliella pelovolcani]|uniref:hypothetical protein n=1 Tax=Belliella pelovolcani TaxID=529505 RepID=UPI00391BCE2B